MTNTITLNPSEIISVQNNELKTTSLLVAETFKKRHRDIVRKIEALDIPNKFRERNFTPTDFIDKNGDSQKCIEMTKDGFVFLVMSFTGKLANQIKIAYIDAFNFMADKLYKQQPKLESPYIIDEELEHIKKGVGKMVHATGKHWQAVYRDLFDYVQAPSVREIKKERYALACEFLGIPTAFKKKALPKDDTPKLPELPKGHVNIAFNMEKNADYMVRVREGKASRKQLLYCLNPQDEKQDWWLEA